MTGRTVERELGAAMDVNVELLAGHERRLLARIVLFLIVLAFPSAQSAWAQQPVFKTPIANAYVYFDWSGFYLGGHVGYARGNARVTLNDPNPPPSPDAGSGDSTVMLAPAGLMNWRSPFGSLTGGVQLGYNYVLPSRMLIGFEADASFLNYLAGDDLVWTRLSTSAEFSEKVDYMGTARVRLGRTMGHWLVYATGGFAWSQGRYLANPGVTDDTDKLLHLHKGWAAGAGVETAIAREWILRLEYLYRNFGEAGVLFPSGVLAQSAYDVHSLRLGLNYKPDWSGAGIQVALPGPKQLHPLGANQGNVDRERLPRGAALEWRRALLQPGAAAGIWSSRYDGCCGVSERRSPEIQFCLSAFKHIAPVLSRDHRTRRRAGIRGKQLRADGRKERCLTPHVSGRPLRRA
jgi:opacity protein-like surface antigen